LYLFFDFITPFIIEWIYGNSFGRFGGEKIPGNDAASARQWRRYKFKKQCKTATKQTLQLHVLSVVSDRWLQINLLSSVNSDRHCSS
jgi:hypothetical protein